MKRNAKNNGVDVSIRIVNMDGKILGSRKGVMKGIGDAGKLSAVLAAETAPIIRSADSNTGKTVKK